MLDARSGRIRGGAGAGERCGPPARCLCGICALGDALAVHAPPEKPITFDWPDAIHVDGGLVGGGDSPGPPDADEHEPPAWLVFGATIRTVAMNENEAGLRRSRRRWRTKVSTISARAACRKFCASPDGRD